MPVPAHGVRDRGEADVHVHGRAEETSEAGDAYYAPPGHTPMLHAGSEVVEFSPSRELQQTMEVVEKNMAAAGA